MLERVAGCRFEWRDVLYLRPRYDPAMRTLTVEINEVASTLEDKRIELGVFVIVEGLNNEIHVRRDRQSGPVEAHYHSPAASFYAADVIALSLIHI